MLRKEGVLWFLLGSLGFRRAAFPRDMRFSISSQGVPPYLPLLSFPLYATFVSVFRPSTFVLRPAAAVHLCFFVFVFVLVFVVIKIYRPIAKPLSS